MLELANGPAQARPASRVLVTGLCEEIYRMQAEYLQRRVTILQQLSARQRHLDEVILGSEYPAVDSDPAEGVPGAESGYRPAPKKRRRDQ